MANKFHINGDGNVRPCNASVGSCPLSTPDEHYDSYEAAREAFEDAQSAVPEILSRRSAESARSFEAVSFRDEPLTPDEEEKLRSLDPLYEAPVPSEYAGMTQAEIDQHIWEQEQEERAYEEQMEYERRNRWSGL